MLFGERVKALRKSQGLTQEELAVRLGVTKRTIINYESGACYPKQGEQYSRLAAIFGVDIDYLMSEKDYFVREAEERFGSRARKQAESLVQELNAMFAGGELADEDKDAVMEALMRAYFESKEVSRKYTPKKYQKDKRPPSKQETEE